MALGVGSLQLPQQWTSHLVLPLLPYLPLSVASFHTSGFLLTPAGTPWVPDARQVVSSCHQNLECLFFHEQEGSHSCTRREKDRATLKDWLC